MAVGALGRGRHAASFAAFCTFTADAASAIATGPSVTTASLAIAAAAIATAALAAAALAAAALAAASATWCAAALTAATSLNPAEHAELRDGVPRDDVRRPERPAAV